MCAHLGTCRHVVHMHAHAGLAARMSTQLMRERQEQERLAAEEMDFERIMGWGLGPMDALDKEQDVCTSLQCSNTLKTENMINCLMAAEHDRQHGAVHGILHLRLILC